MHLNLSIQIVKEDRNALSHKNQEEDDASNDVLNLSIQILLKVELMKKLKIKSLTLFLVKA